MARTKQTARRSTGGKSVSHPLAARAARKTPSKKTPTKRRAKPGMKALKEIRQAQKTTELLIPRRAFARLVREVTQDFLTDARFQSAALGALQEATESYMIEFLDHTQQLAIHAKRIGITAKDVWRVRSLWRALGAYIEMS